MMRASPQFTPVCDLQSNHGHEAALASLPGERRTFSVVARTRSEQRPHFVLILGSKRRLQATRPCYPSVVLLHVAAPDLRPNQ